MVTVKPVWGRVRKRFLIFSFAMCCGVPLLFLLAIIFSRRPDIQNDPPYILVLFAFITAVSGSLLSYLLFISRRISFDGKRLSFRKNFLTVKSFPIEAITSLEYNAELQLLIINRCGVFTCKFFDSGEIQQLQEAVARHINK